MGWILLLLLRGGEGPGPDPECGSYIVKDGIYVMLDGAYVTIGTPCPVGAGAPLSPIGRRGSVGIVLATNVRASVATNGHGIVPSANVEAVV